MRLVRLINKAVCREFHRLVVDNAIWLGENWASSNSDFYFDSTRRESFGCIVSNFMSKRYKFKEGRSLFVSESTLKEGAFKEVHENTFVLDDLEFIVAFEKFSEAKTGEAIGQWMVEAHMAQGLRPNYVFHHSTDAAANAIKSMEEYAERTLDQRTIPLDQTACTGHAVNSSATKASGTAGLNRNDNEELSTILRKLHRILARIQRSPARQKVLAEVQSRKGRKVIRKPRPGVVTRWNSEHKEVSHTNVYMGDLCEAVTKMLAPGGTDHHLVSETDDEGNLVDPSCNFLSVYERLVLRMYECAAEPVLKLSKFTQLNKPTIHEALFNVRARIDECRDHEFTMYFDISNSTLPDLSKRVKSEKVIDDVFFAGEARGDTEHEMPACIEQLRDVFADDLELRCKLKYKPDRSEGKVFDMAQLPRDIAMGCLLNPMYGGKLLVFIH